MITYIDVVLELDASGTVEFHALQGLSYDVVRLSL
jgi:hypothetical protein